MSTLAEQILRARKAKGFSQNELAELTGLNIRTIQRIEKGDTEPRGHSLRQLFEVLNIDVEQVLDYGKKDNIQVIQMMYISVVSGIVIPLGAILVPLIIWLFNKNKINHLDRLAKNFISIQVIITILVTLLIVSAPSFIKMVGPDYSLKVLWGILIIVIFSYFLYPILVAILIRVKGVKDYYPRFFKQ